MKKKINLSMILFVCAFLISCTGPGTGPGGTYTQADHQRDQTNTAIAVGATAVGAAVVGGALYNAGRRDATPSYPAPGYAPRPPHHRPPVPPPHR